MHEASLAQEVLRAMLADAGARNASRVLSVSLEIGAAAGVVNEALEFALVAMASGSIAEGLTVNIETIPLMVRCHVCAAESPTEPWFYQCADCGHRDVEVVSGREMRVISMDIDIPS